MDRSQGTLVQDREQKARIYARAKIPAYWVINLVDRQVEVFTRPSGSLKSPRYAGQAVCRGNDWVPFVLDGNVVAQLRAADLLP